MSATRSDFHYNNEMYSPLVMTSIFISKQTPVRVKRTKRYFCYLKIIKMIMTCVLRSDVLVNLKQDQHAVEIDQWMNTEG